MAYREPGSWMATSPARTAEEIARQEYEDEAMRRQLSGQYGFTPAPAKSNSFMDSYGAGSNSGGGTSAPTNEYENKLRSLMSNPNSIADSGAYKFAFNQGQQALERSAAAKGMTGSGNVLAELAKYGQDMAAQQYDTEANRLASLSSAKDQFQLGRESNALKEKATMFDIYNKTPRFVIA